MLASMDGRARPYELAPGVVIKLLPFRPAISVSMYDVFLKYNRREDEKHGDETISDEDAGLRNIFIVVCPILTSVCVVPDTELSSAMQSFIEWVNGRTSNIVENWQSFQWMVDIEIATSLWEAHAATRDDLPKAPAVLQQPAPIPVDGNGNEAKPTVAGGRKSVTR